MVWLAASGDEQFLLAPPVASLLRATLNKSPPFGLSLSKPLASC